VQFQNDGNVLINSGTFSSGDIVTTNPSEREFIVKWWSGANLMRIDAGGLSISGDLSKRRSSVSASSYFADFVIRDVSDTGSTARILLTKHGDLQILGSVYTVDGEAP
jgi:hypothetical protein